MTPGKSVAQLISIAKDRISTLDPREVAAELATGGALLVDLRESEERSQHGVIPGALHAPRGLLEFYADEGSPQHRAEFRRDRRIILLSASGGRSALAADTLRILGYGNVAHLEGGVEAWRAAGQPIAAVTP